jgi:hypothetical protein
VRVNKLIGPSWYDENATRRYPLADSATGIDDSGQSLPHDMLVDLHIRFPRNYGTVAYLGAMQWTPGVRTAVIIATDGTSETAIGAVTVAATGFVAGRPYPITSLVDGAVGWIVFGQYMGTTPRRLVFSSATQAELLPRLAAGYSVPPVLSLAKLHDPVHLLTGLVEFAASTNMSIKLATREVDGADQTVVCFSLDAVAPDLYTELSGPVGHRAESGTCNFPPVEQLNQVTPDCNGNIDIVFVSNCLLLGEPAGSSAGLAIDYCLGLGNACTRNLWLPKDGVLKNEYDDRCLEPLPPDSSEQPPDPPPPEPSSQICGSLPLSTVFADWPSELLLISGGFDLVAEGIKIASSGTRCLAVWDDCAYPKAAGHRCETRLSLLPGGLETAGMVVDYKQSTATTFFNVELSKPDSAFRLRYYNGSGFVQVAAVAPVGLQYGVEYDIHVTITDAQPALVTCLLYKSGVLLATINYHTQLITDAYGLFGIHANQSNGYFHSLLVDAI